VLHPVFVREALAKVPDGGPDVVVQGVRAKVHEFSLFS
jgi:hypothetical protein